MPKLLVICGPTASGKTSLAVKCAKALETEIISADSMLVYKGLDIGTAKPTEEEKEGIKHHLIDVASPLESFSVSDYEKLALPIAERLLKEGKTPVVCGGTGFYVRALLYKSQFGNAGADEAVRKNYEAVLSERGAVYLHKLLEERDPESAKILHFNDTKRVIRALEIFEVTGKKKSEQKDEEIPRFDFVSVSVDFPRAALYERLARGIDEKRQCMQGIGYKEVAEGLRLGSSDEEIAEAVKKNTRNYAKRQITFFKRMQNHSFLSPQEAAAEKVLSLL